MFNDIILTPRADREEAEELLHELEGRGIVIGTDEAGRGALAGPVVAAAVYLTREQEEELLAMNLKDSKQILPKKREKIFAAMQELGVMWRAYCGSVDMIERHNILQASLWAMGISATRLAKCLPSEPACIIVDGTERIPRLRIPQWTLIAADKLIPVVSAASVVAKVLRDRLMQRLDTRFPGYDLGKNKGYPTQFHMNAVHELGISAIHRPSFCKTVLKRWE